jgi:hypothetical protein
MFFFLIIFKPDRTLAGKSASMVFASRSRQKEHLQDKIDKLSLHTLRISVAPFCPVLEKTYPDQ